MEWGVCERSLGVGLHLVWTGGVHWGGRCGREQDLIGFWFGYEV